MITFRSAYESKWGGVNSLLSSIYKPLVVPMALLTLPVSGWALTTNSDGYYQIASSADLVEFATLVNDGATDANAILTADIDMAEVEYTPIGNSLNAYTGTFDGDEHVISNLTISGTQYLGLFGCTDEGAVIKNLGIKDVSVTATGEYSYSAALVGYAISVTMTDCYVEGGAISGVNTIGGLIGYASIGYSNNSPTILTNCYNTAKVTSTSSYVGGLIGNSLSTTILTDCYNAGVIESSGHYNGGLIGHMTWTYHVTLTNCYNTGDVRSSGSYNGGLIGFGNQLATITKCYNTGAIEGYGCVGGLIGLTYSYAIDITNCYNTGSVTATSESDDAKDCAGGIIGFNNQHSGWELTLENCYNTGTITAQITGALIGNNYKNEEYSDYLIINNCYYLSTGSSTCGGTSKTADEFASGEVCYLLQGEQEEQVWGQDLTTDASPVLTSAESLKVVKDGEGYANVVADDDSSTAVASLVASDKTVAGIYTLAGTKVTELQRGVNIVVYSDGTAQKVLVK